MSLFISSCSGNISSFLGIPRMQPGVWLFWLSWVEWDEEGFRKSSMRRQKAQLSGKLREHPWFQFMASISLHWGWMEGMEVACVRTATKMKSEEAETARWELGKGQRVVHVGKEGQGVCSFGYVLWCSTLLLSSLNIRKIAFVVLCVWYNSSAELERALGNTLCY